MVCVFLQVPQIEEISHSQWLNLLRRVEGEPARKSERVIEKNATEDPREELKSDSGYDNDKLICIVLIKF